MTEPSDTPIYDQLVREQEQQQCSPDPQDDTGPGQPAEEPAWPSPS